MTIEQNLQNHYQEYLTKCKQDLLQKWKQIDNHLLKTKNNIWVMKDFKERTLWDPNLGLIIFKRRRYQNKITKKYKFFLDEHLGIPPKLLVLPLHRELALFYYQVFKSYKEIAFNVFGGEVSKMSIHRFIKDSSPEFVMQNFTCFNDGILWINADGCWMKMHKSKQNIEVKNFVFFTGREVNRYGKWQLIGKVMKHFVGTSDNEMINSLNQIIDQFKDVREIRLVGDGAAWIKRVAKTIGAIYYIDKFHIRKALKDLLGQENYYSGLKLLTEEMTPKTLKLELLKIIANNNTGEVDSKKLKLLGYIINNHKHYLKTISDHPTNGIEALQAHHQCKYLKNQRKGFSIAIIDKLITTFFNFANKGWEFTNWQRHLHDFDTGTFRTGKNVPVFNYGLSSTGTYKVLKQLINS